jgi:O-antigen/teichoic acid export membrane protein
VINLTRFLTILLLNVVLVGYLRLGVLGALVSTLLGALVGAGLGLFLARSYVRLAIDPDRLRQMARFGLPLVVVGCAVFVLTSADRYFLKAYTGDTALGIYALAYKIGMVMSMAVNAFTVAWQPLLLRIIQDEEAKRTLARVLLYYLLGSGLLLVVVGSFSPEIVSVLATPAFAPAGRVVPFILASYLLFGIYYFFTLGSIVLERTRLIAANVLVAMVINLVANALLIPPLGITGAATATILSYLVLAIGMFLVSQRLYPLPVPILRILGLGAVVAAILLVNCCLAPPGTGWGWGIKLLTVALFLPAAAGLRILDGEDRRRIYALLRRNLPRG